MMERHWINAPSNQQVVHHWHGKNVLVDMSDRCGILVTVYFTQGDTISAMIPAMYLAKGWNAYTLAKEGKQNVLP